jgi:hypothetical protein
MKFRKKPVVIDAVQVGELLNHAAKNWKDLPDYIAKAYDDGEIIFLSDKISIRTLEGVMMAQSEDWIIRGVAGELYPCRPDIFEKTYEAVI